ncbi:hypothetical protein ACQKWADRAFT_308750 [Trichoderma austrokoningii]
MATNLRQRRALHDLEKAASVPDQPHIISRVVEAYAQPGLCLYPFRPSSGMMGYDGIVEHLPVSRFTNISQWPAKTIVDIHRAGVSEGRGREDERMVPSSAELLDSTKPVDELLFRNRRREQRSNEILDQMVGQAIAVQWSGQMATILEHVRTVPRLF